jgi:hypothetical protein
MDEARVLRIFRTFNAGAEPFRRESERHDTGRHETGQHQEAAP